MACASSSTHSWRHFGQVPKTSEAGRGPRSVSLTHWFRLYCHSQFRLAFAAQRPLPMPKPALPCAGLCQGERLLPSRHRANDSTGMAVTHVLRGLVSEPFSSCVCLADLQYVDGLGELAGAPGAAAELAEDVPVLELGVRALAG